MVREIDIDIECWYQKYCGVRDIEPDMPDYPKCKKSCPMYLGMNFLMQNCGMPDAYPYIIRLTPPDEDIEAFKKLGDIKDNIDEFIKYGNNILIESIKAQTAKTTWSLKLMYRYFDKIWVGNGFTIRGYFVHVPSFLNDLKNYKYINSDDFRTKDKLIKNVDIVIWDDLIQPLNQEEQITLTSYISRRILEKKSNIFNGRVVKNRSNLIGNRLDEYLNLANEKILFKSDSFRKN